MKNLRSFLFIISDYSYLNIYLKKKTCVFIPLKSHFVNKPYLLEENSHI